MCGIAGYFRRDGGPVLPEIVARMTEQLIHRGPDDHGIHVADKIGLGHRRLSIRDLSTSGRQPMSDPSGRVVVSYNGELYNDAELRRELESRYDLSFRTKTDTEIIPAGYLAWGEGVFERLEGMFAIALWDEIEGKLYLARDGIGIKPLYYYVDEGKVLFGSEIKAILASGLCPRRIDPPALHTYLAAGHAGPGASLLQGVAQVRPGTILSFTDRSKTDRTFWQPTRTGDIDSHEEALDEFSRLLPAIVEAQLVSDVPLSIFQSGGVDSTLITLATRQLGISPPLFTAGFAERSHDESDIAAEVAAIAGAAHHVLPIETDPDPLGTFRRIVHHFDGQCADTGAYAFYRICREVRKHSTVVLSGDGGDEFFAGYDTYRASRLAAAAAPWTTPFLMKTVGRAAYHLDASNDARLPAAAVAARFALGIAAAGPDAHMQWRRLVPDFILPKLYGRDMDACLETSPFAEYEQCAGSQFADPLDRWLLADQRFHIQSILAKVDAMSMAHGLEVRVPLLDRRIMDFAGRCSAGLLFPRGGQRKALLRSTARRMGAPASVTDGGKKGFNVPIARMLRNELAPLSIHWFEKSPDVLAPMLQADAVRNLWRTHFEGKVNHAFALWPLLNLAEWLGNP
jgi:asparagine synthase (glutamine-hydrolysing)